MMKKFYVLIALLLVCSLGYANSLDRFIDKYKEKNGAKYVVINEDTNLDELVDGDGFVFSLQGRKGLLRQLGSQLLNGLGVEEIELLDLEGCKKGVRKRFCKRSLKVIPEGYELLAESRMGDVYLCMTGEGDAQLLIVSREEGMPRLTLVEMTPGLVEKVIGAGSNGVSYLESAFEKYLRPILQFGGK